MNLTNTKTVYNNIKDALNPVVSYSEWIKGKPVVEYDNEYWFKEEDVVTVVVASIKPKVTNGSKQAKDSNYLPVEDLKELLELKTGHTSITSLLEYYGVPYQQIGNRTYWSLKESILANKQWMKDSKLKSKVSKCTYIHEPTNLVYVG